MKQCSASICLWWSSFSRVDAYVCVVAGSKKPLEVPK